MLSIIFRVVAGILVGISRLTGLTYNQVNIIVYYFVIPFSWAIMLDIILEFHYFKIAFIGACYGFYVGCPNFKNYSDRLFTRSVTFLNYFNKWGSNYVAASVWICVTLPLIIYVVLLMFILR